MPERKKFERLPTNVLPQVYHLFLEPNLKTFTFDGKETVEIKVLQACNKIVLNSVSLNIKSVSLMLESESKTLVPEYSSSVEEETLTLQFSEMIPIGNSLLAIEFSGELNDKMIGFYRSKYLKVAGEEDAYFAVTQFESSDARRCFPCWDEPAIKARFDITLSVEPSKVALSNMPVESESKNESGKKIVKFSRTPLMSTYLLAFIVGDFDYVEETSSDGVLVRVYTPPGKQEQGRFALYVAARVLPFYKEYFQIAYPLPKMDLVAVSELPCGAMENWGLVTYRETYLLVDEANTSAATRQTVATVIGHELAHQWFGNLVTMEWWTHLWLNEGYASFVENLCVAYLFPEYDIWTQFATDTYCRALGLDALENSHPIEIPVGHPSEIDEIFDEISYEKGASIIRMLHKYIGDEDFRKGMNLYLTRHQYGNTCTEDLWTALEEASSKPIKAVMPTWTKQIGFPMITVESSVQEGSSRVLVLSQTKFFAEKTQEDNESLWMVPMSFCTKSNPNEDYFTTILESRRCKITIPNVAADDWVKLNPGIVGFYRTKYPSELLQQFIPSIENKSLPPLDRLGILEDLFALIQAGQASTVEALDLIQAMKEEDNYTVWASISTCMERIHNLLVNANCVDLFDAYGLKIMKPIYNKLGYENKADESHLTTLLRSLVLNRLIRYGDKDFAEVARKQFAEHCNGTKIIPADLRSVIYRAVMSVDGPSAFNSLIKIYRATDSQEEKDRILQSFTAVTDAGLVDDILKFVQSDDVNPSSAVTAITSIASSKGGHDKSFEFVKENFDKLVEKYRGGFLLVRLVTYTIKNFASKQKADEIEAFFASKNVSSLKRTIQQSVEKIRNNAAWLDRDGELIKNYLKKL